MALQVHIPSILRHTFQTQRLEQLQATSVRAMVEALDDRYPGIGERLLEPDGQLRRYVSVFLDGEMLRREGGSSTSLAGVSEVWIVTNVAGG